MSSHTTHVIVAGRGHERWAWQGGRGCACVSEGVGSYGCGRGIGEIYTWLFSPHSAVSRTTHVIMAGRGHGKVGVAVGMVGWAWLCVCQGGAQGVGSYSCGRGREEIYTWLFSPHSAVTRTTHGRWA